MTKVSFAHLESEYGPSFYPIHAVPSVEDAGTSRRLFPRLVNGVQKDCLLYLERWRSVNSLLERVSIHLRNGGMTEYPRLSPRVKGHVPPVYQKGNDQAHVNRTVLILLHRPGGRQMRNSIANDSLPFEASVYCSSITLQGKRRCPVVQTMEVLACYQETAS